MVIKLFHFRIPIIATLLVLIGLYILTSLGRWQLSRADQKEAILAQIDSRQTMQAISLSRLDQESDKAYFHLAVNGNFDNDHYLLLDNRILNGRPGFEVIQPLIAGHRVILVNRGWIPLPADRNNLPSIPSENASRTISGIVHEPADAIVLKEDQLIADKSWPKLIQALDLQKLTALYDDLNYSIEPWVLRQDPEESDFYRRQWQFTNMPPERHVSYAVTWFGLAIALVIIYIAALLRLKEK